MTPPEEGTTVSTTSFQQRLREQRTARLADLATDTDEVSGEVHDAVFEVEDVSVRYGTNLAIDGIDLRIPRGEITAFIGPSGCGKSTLLRTLNRMNDLIDGCHVSGRVSYNGEDIYDPDVDPTEVRRRIGMVFQKPNPFPVSIYDNVAFGPRLHAMTDDLDGRVERALRSAALWDEVKDKLDDPGLAISGGQQQRLCIARAIAMDPEVVLLDEPCSALDPIATLHIEDLLRELRGEYSIVIVTHNMQQAARVSDRTAFFSVDVDEQGGTRTGVMVEFDRTETIFTRSADPRTEGYITGRFG